MMVLSNDSLVPTTPVTCFDNGKYTTKSTRVPKSSSFDTPSSPLYVVFPTEVGTYPVILFLHGFCVPNDRYNELFTFIASHGYIIVAPSETEFWKGLFERSAVDQVKQAADTSNWINENGGQNLQNVLPLFVSPDLEKVALTGHSKGGKAAFALALGHAQTSLDFKALIGLDPVAGTDPANEIPPKILTLLPQNFNISIPVAVIGLGLGNESLYGCFPPAAPYGCNHLFFFKKCKPPCCYFVAKDYGHMDVVDGWMAQLASIFVCPGGKGSREDLRKACGGIFVAFLKAYLSDDFGDLTAIVNSPSLAPVKFDPVSWVQS